MQRKSLTDILSGNNGNFDDLWNNTAAAGEFGPLPAGEYVCHVTRGELENSRQNKTPGYKIEFTVLDGEFRGRKVWHDCWLTPAALPQSKRDLARIGITSPAQMEQPLPRSIRCAVKVALRTEDDGTERNRVRSFTVIGIDPPDADPFAPSPSPSPSPGCQPAGDAAEPTGEVDASFSPNTFTEGGAQ